MMFFWNFCVYWWMMDVWIMDDWNIWVWWSCFWRMMNEWILDHMYEIWSKVVMKSCLKNREHEKTKYEIRLYKVLWNILWEYDFILIVFLNKPNNRTNPNRTKPICLVWFHFWKTVNTEPIQTDDGFISSEIFLTENQSKPNCYTPNTTCLSPPPTTPSPVTLHSNHPPKQPTPTFDGKTVDTITTTTRHHHHNPTRHQLK